jgi:hypothetical protein
MQARIYEQGNGFPDTGDFVPGDGVLYLVTGESFGPIQTGDSRGNWLGVSVEEADWADCDEESVFTALCVPFGADFAQAVKVAASDVSRLRRPDVFRVLEERPSGMDLDALAGWLVAERPDLVDEVQDALAELRGVAE